MHSSDIICMTSITHEVDSDMDVEEVLELLQLIPSRSVSFIKEEKLSSDVIKHILGKYADCNENIVVFDKDACTAHFQSLYDSFISKATKLTLEDFCNQDCISDLKTVSNDTPIILYCDTEVGLLTGVLEDFLRMPRFLLDKEYKITGLYSRHS